MVAWKYKISPRVEKCISALEEKFCISSGHVISSIFKLIVITVNNDNENDNDND